MATGTRKGRLVAEGPNNQGDTSSKRRYGNYQHAFIQQTTQIAAEKRGKGKQNHTHQHTGTNQRQPEQGNGNTIIRRRTQPDQMHRKQMPPTRRVRSKNPHQETRDISNTPDQPRDEPDPGRNHSTHQGPHTRKNGRPEPPIPLIPPQRPHTWKRGQPSNLRTSNLEWTKNTHRTR